MKTRILMAATTLVGALTTTAAQSSAATLDDVIARLDSLQRDNTAMRREIASLRAQQRVAVPPGRESAVRRPAADVTPVSHGDRSAALSAPVRYLGPYDWSGFHAGVHLGYGWGRDDWGPMTFETSFRETPLENGARHDLSGWLGGVQVGLDYQTGRLVLGAGASLFYAGLQGKSRTALDFGGLTIDERAQTNIDWLATVTGRAGVALDNVLLYGKGGIAAAGVDYKWRIDAPGGSFYDRVNEDRFGWIVGAGVELAIWRNWSFALEYNYVDLGTGEVVVDSGQVATNALITHDIKTNLHLAKVGLNYRFGAPE